MQAELLDSPIEDEQQAAQQVIAVIGIAPKTIKTQEQYEDGLTWLGGVVKRRKAIEAFFDSLKKPIRQSLNALKTKEDGILAPLLEEEAKLKRMTGAWFMEAKRLADEKQQKENEKHQQKVQAALIAGKDPDAVAAPKVIDTPTTTVKSSGGPTVTMRMIKNWRVTKVPTLNQQTLTKIYRSDHPMLEEIPDSCWVLDTARANAAAKSGMTPALQLYDVPSQAVS